MGSQPHVDTMPYSKFVEIGRVVLICQGPETGKLAVVVDVIDQNRALVDGPLSITGVHRHAVNFKQIMLTSFKVDITRSCKEAAVAKAFKAADISGKWSKSAWAKKLENRANLSDFDRFKVMVARKKRSTVIKKELAK